MKTIYKYPAPLTVFVEHVQALPVGAKFCHLGKQAGLPMMWFEVDPEQRETESRVFFFTGTGRLVENHSTHLGTVIDGPFVWHLYEVVGSVPPT